MPTHRGELVLEEIKNTLINAGGPVGNNFKRGRRAPLAKASLPFGLVRFRDEDIRRIDGNVFIDRLMRVSVFFYLADTPADLATPEIETEMLELRRVYENALQAATPGVSGVLNGLAIDLEVRRFGEPRIEVRDEDYGQLEMELLVRYRTRRTDAAAL